jgi:TIR domain-containing protein
MSQAHAIPGMELAEAAEPQATFLSYSRDDSSFVLKLAPDLKAAGADVWLDQMDISPGQRWDLAIQEALASCSRLIVVLSPSSVASTTVLDEVSFALENHKTVIPVLYRDCEIPFRLGRLQYVDFRGEYARGFEGLLRTMKAPLQERGISPKSKAPASSYRPEPSPTSEPHEKTGRTDRSPLLAGSAATKVSVGAGLFLILAAVLWFGSLARSHVSSPSSTVQPSLTNGASESSGHAVTVQPDTSRHNNEQPTGKTEVKSGDNNTTKGPKPEKTAVNTAEYEQLRTRLVQTQEEARAAVGFWAPIKADLARSNQSLRPEIQTALGVLTRSTDEASRSLRAGNLTGARVSLDSADQQLRILQQYEKE